MGIGKDFAFLLAQDGFDLVLVARSEDKLQALAQEIVSKNGRKVKVIPMDCGKPGAAKSLFNQLKDAGISVHTLINNAGFGNNGAFLDTALDKEAEMIQLNVLFLVELSHFLVTEMKKQKSGAILNVASTAGFQPGPYMTNYYATKAYVLSFSEGLAEELSAYGIRVSVLCPGPTRTEFFERAGMSASKLAKSSLLAMDSLRVAKIGLRGLQRGRVVQIAGLLNFFLAQSVRLTPRFLVRKIAKFLNRA